MARPPAQLHGRWNHNTHYPLAPAGTPCRCVLEVGCGDGLLLGLLADRGRRGLYEHPAPVRDPVMTLGRIRRSVRAILPDARVRTRLYWRWSLEWTPVSYFWPWLATASMAAAAASGSRYSPGAVGASVVASRS